MLGDRIKELRAINKMTQKDLADFLGVTPKAVSFYELNQREPSTDIILKMAQRFNVSTDYLYGRPDVTQLPGYIGAGHLLLPCPWALKKMVRLTKSQ